MFILFFILDFLVCRFLQTARISGKQWIKTSYTFCGDNRYTLTVIYGVTVITRGRDTVTKFKAVSISQSANIIEKRLTPTILPLTIRCRADWVL